MKETRWERPERNVFGTKAGEGGGEGRKSGKKEVLSLLISDQHVDVPQRQQRTNTNTNVPPLAGTMMQWPLAQSIQISHVGSGASQSERGQRE